MVGSVLVDRRGNYRLFRTQFLLFCAGRTEPVLAIEGNAGHITSTDGRLQGYGMILWLDEIHFVPPKKPWKVDSPVHTNDQWCLMVA